MPLRKVFVIIISIILIVSFSCCKENGSDGDDNDEFGSITGTVYAGGSSLGAVPLEGATVSVSGTNLSATTDSQGHYNINSVPAGSQTLQASAAGYSTATATVTVSANGTVTQDFTLTPSTGGNTYYVSTSGSNSNNGSYDHPWATPGYGSRQLKAGDTLIILAGTYSLSVYDDDIITPPAGTASALITIKGQDGNRPKLEGSNDLIAAIDVSNSSYIKIQNIEITSASGQVLRDGIQGFGADLVDVVFEDLYIHHINEFGIDLQDVNSLQVKNCRIEYCGFGAMGGPGGESGGWRNVKISGCTLAYSGHFYAGGENPYDRPDGFGIETSNGPIEIYDTTSEHNKGDGLDSKAANTYIHHCIVANNRCDGVKLWGGGSRVENTLIYGTGDGDPTGTPWAGIVIGTEQAGTTFYIINVTLHENYQRQGYPIYAQYDQTASITIYLRNTIIANAEGAAYFGGSVTLYADHNIFYMPTRADQVQANDRSYTASELYLLGEGNVSLDPLFILPAWGTTGNYKLTTGSPGINTGTSNGAPSDDLEHTSRPQGAGYDKGAYEQ